MLFPLCLFFVELLGHVYEFLSSGSSSIGQKPRSSEGTLLSMRRIKLVYEKVAWKVLAHAAVLFVAIFRARIESTRTPEQLSHLITTACTAWRFLSVKETAYSTVCATRGHKVLAHALRLEYQQIEATINGWGQVLFPTSPSGTRACLLELWLSVTCGLR